MLVIVAIYLLPIHRRVSTLSFQLQHVPTRSRSMHSKALLVFPPLDAYVNDDNDDNERRELIPANRRRNRSRSSEIDDDKDKDEPSTIENDFQRTENQFRDDRSNNSKESFAGNKYWDIDEDDEDEEDLFDDDIFDFDDLQQYDLLENIIIPNPLLDSIDPDGTIERLPELFRDPRFWFDMVLFVLFLDFLSFAGPQNDPFIEFPWFYGV
jgi:hypothetical protein